MRAGVIPWPNAVGAGKAGRVLVLMGQIARLSNDEGAAVETEDRSGGKRNWLIGAVPAARITTEHRGLERDILPWLHAHADAGCRQRICGSRGRQVGRQKGRPANAIVYEIGCSLALEELAVR